MASLTLLVVVGGLLAGCGAFMAVLALRPAGPTGADVVVGRLDAYQMVDQPMNLDEAEAALSFRERILWPLLRNMGARLARRRSTASQAELQRTLNLAGRPLGLTAGDYLAVRYVAAALCGVGGALLGVVLGSVAFSMFGLAFGAVAGLLVPRYVLAARVKRAQKEIRLALPDAMDLMSVCVEAGLTFEGAMGKVAERYHNALGGEFSQVLRELRLGRSRRDAMADIGDRTGVAEVHSFAQAVIQSDALGTGIARVLRLQSDELRRRRRQRAQEQGAKAGLKILFPMVIFIFPSLWIVLLGPAALLLLQEFTGH